MERTEQSQPTTPSPRKLRWGVKASLIAYVSGMSDGHVAATPPATVSDDGFAFPSDPAVAGESAPAPLHFRGTVTLSGHSGMLRLVFADPAITGANGGWTLTIADPHEPGARLPFASIAALVAGADETLRGTGLRLTEAGADLFFSGPYTAGTELDDFEIRPERGPQ
ncbi:HtaA domain-containing protein [Leucobacter luti]|uniref:Htaa protein n=1 Tax=Leucobacter luti TaxID=340320 RepID=A0A4Q7TZW1_9MICO|nr:HtaA domain-containing protein [Leucobacter luti]RZT66691.1 Htaa protein [Leucobacter luti]